MSRFHDQTLKLLGPECLLEEHAVPKLKEWAKRNKVVLPEAYLEWALLDGKNLLRKYSNDDEFEFEEPQIITTPQGVRGILFHTENQGNFIKILALDQGDDPPVHFHMFGNDPWVIYSERFSECIFAQIFDWQYWLEFDPGDPDYKEITYYGDIKLKTNRCVAILRDRRNMRKLINLGIVEDHLVAFRQGRGVASLGMFEIIRL